MNSQSAQWKQAKSRPATLKTVAERVGLTDGTVSAVLINSPASRSVPERTRNRIFAAARALNYQPNYLARSLRVRRTFMVGVITEEIGDPYGSLIIAGIERYLRERDFFFLTVAHRHEDKLLGTYLRLLLQRGVEGLISVDTSIAEPQTVPTVAIAGHKRVPGVTNIVLNHCRAARLALRHLLALGHRDIAFMKGSSFSSDAEERWKAVRQVARELGIRMREDLIVQLEGDDPTPQLGFPFAQQLLARKRPFTALFAYNDISALGSIRAFQEAGLRVPEDISVVGFDDIQLAAQSTPGLTTVRQPLHKMGEIAARTLLDRIEGRVKYVPEIQIEPELVIRNSTARPRSRPRPATARASASRT